MKVFLGKCVLGIFVLLAVFVGGYLLFALPIYQLWTAAFNGAFTWKFAIINFIKLVFAPFISLAFVTLGACIKCAFCEEEEEQHGESSR